jgi:hypothetical protein
MHVNLAIVGRRHVPHEATAVSKPDDFQRRGLCLSRRTVGTHEQNESEKKMRWTHG